MTNTSKQATGTQVAERYTNMKLMTKAIENKFQKTGRQEDSDPLIIAKFFTPDSTWTWYATEYNAEDRTFYGYTIGHEGEWGYFSRDELETVRGKLGLHVERDMWFRSVRFSQVRDERLVA